ncbi:hypothetical protein MF406_13865 [Georgenia sp. TF02-10]|uniref:hypothetical protein n=1 Tax=Georgenia sp. TF02-10 TaxID=2917725 RepID=UPI001FA76A41|nr:hypothetical protein [Georgenia sp. TF02-10]UNX56544.1 hypothetical protein MF406_13865 [Georgenia sp. TF02-10]
MSAQSSSAAPAAAPAEVPPPRLEILTDLRADVARVTFPLDLPGAAGLRDLRARILHQLDARLVPRLRGSAVPTVVVLGGSSGAGKSSLLNAVVGAAVSAAGVLRPTTRTAVVAVHPDDAAAFATHPLAVLTDVRPDPGVPAGLALVDAPDLDSVHADNRSLARLLLEVADLWVFTTTAARYGDAVPWRQLTAAHARGLTTAVVLNRVPARALRPVRADLLRRMDALGFGGAPLFVVPDVGPLDGPLPPGTAGELGDWLRLVAARRQGEALAARTTRGVWPALREQLLALADGADAQVRARDEVRAVTVAAAEAPATKVAAEIRDGRAGAGAPTTLWLALASTGGPLAPLVGGRAGRVGGAGRRRRAVAARSSAAATLGAEAAAALTLLVADALRDATTAITRSWAEPAWGLPAGLAPAAPVVGEPEPAAVPRTEAGATPRADAEATPSAGGGSGQPPSEPGATGGAAPGDPAARVAGDVVAAWRADVERVVDPGADGPLDGAGLAGLVQAGAAGVTGAASAVADLAGPEAVTRARTDLAARAAAAVRDAARPYLTALDHLEIEPGTALRLRATELKEHR